MRAALAFLTPLGGARSPSPAAARWFPLVGLLVGAGVGVAWWGAGEVWPAVTAAAVAVAVDLALTGMLHVDGLADSGDGLLPHLPRQRRLEVMREPTVGAFGVAVVVVVLLLRWSALAAMAADVALVAGLWCLSRTLMAVTLGVVPYARPNGLGDAFRGRGAGTTALVGGAAGVAAAVAAEGIAGIGVAVLAVAAGAAVVGLGVRRLGGFTGDVLGAAGVVAETVGLLAAAARW